LDDARINAELSKSKIDLSLPGTPVYGAASIRSPASWKKSPMFSSVLGFSVAEGPEVETDDN
jgi:hypothetical protein